FEAYHIDVRDVFAVRLSCRPVVSTWFDAPCTHLTNSLLCLCPYLRRHEHTHTQHGGREHQFYSTHISHARYSIFTNQNNTNRTESPNPSNFIPGCGESSSMGFQSSDKLMGELGILKSMPTTPSALSATCVWPLVLSSY